MKKTKSFIFELKENRPENYHVHDICAMAGRVYRPTDLLEINWSDLDGVEFHRREGPWPQEGLPVREEIVEDTVGVTSSVVVPVLAPVAEDAMEEESSAGSPDN